VRRPARYVPEPGTSYAEIATDRDGFAITTRHGGRGLNALVDRFGPAIWDGGAGGPELNRSGSDPARPWM
jgi:hypothetical protein